jgi:2',3'-cyclic-nucleotide 2'-phosphodiesterase (5'-nucleotidase family)
VLPFPNSVATLQVNGAELSAMLEHSVSMLPFGSGRFLQVSGLCLTVSESATVGNRVSDVVRQAASGSCTGPIVDLTEDVTYVIAIPDFVAMGGDGYPDYSVRMTTHSQYDQTVSAWLAQLQSPFEPLFQGRINILP